MLFVVRKRLCAWFALLVASLSLAAAEDSSTSYLEFGRHLFFDANLSATRTQSCASCHDPNHAFTDQRATIAKGAASLGADGQSFGDRNTPTLGYLGLTPPFERGDDGHYRGGFFLDGRAATLALQAVEPILNPLEMAMPDPAMVLARLREDLNYRPFLRQFEASRSPLHPASVMAMVGDSLGAFVGSQDFAPFDSKYDRYLAGEVHLSALEEMGRALFFSPMTNCANCHLNHNTTLSKTETFTNYRFHNIGLPINASLRVINGLGNAHRDLGLRGNPQVGADASSLGKFKVPSLRNVAVSGPYMHNGVFRELRTAILFYNKYTIGGAAGRINPETGSPWGPAEVPSTVDLELLRQGQPIDAKRADALVAFLRTLTDQRYEHLLAKKEPLLK